MARIFAAKGRPRTSPLIVHVDSVEMARGLAAEWPDAAETLARRYWPGPLTLVVPKRAVDSRYRHGGVADRGAARAGASAGAGIDPGGGRADRGAQRQPLHRTFAHARRRTCPRRWRTMCWTAVRRGWGSNRRCCRWPEPARAAAAGRDPAAGDGGADRTDRGGRKVSAEGAHASPGMHARHYRPATPLYSGEYGGAVPPGNGAWLRVGVRDAGDRGGVCGGALRDAAPAGREGLDWIAVEPPPETPEWAGVLDRLRRAASG